MNKAIESTNVVLNLVISPNMIILDKPVDGYINKLQVASENMRFGVNNNLNYFVNIINQPN